MLQKEKIHEILEKAAYIDKHFELFGSSTHKYKLNPTISKELVRSIEKAYNFTLPEAYFQFITEVGDGGACVDYGLLPFTKLVEKADDLASERFNKAYRESLSKPFCPRKMEAGEVANFGFARAAYEKSPDDFFVFEYWDDDTLCDTQGLLVLGTHGCQWDYGIVITGEFRGKIFDTDNEGGYALLADNFEDFYQQWLDGLEESRLIQTLEKRRNIFAKRKKC